MIIPEGHHLFFIKLSYCNPTDLSSSSSIKIPTIGKKGIEIAELAIIQAQKMDENNITKGKIQGILITKLKPIFNQIDEFLLRDIKNL